MTPQTTLMFRATLVAACALSGVSASAQTTHEQDRAACMRIEGAQERAGCLREAAAVRAQGPVRAPGETPETRWQNAMQRCADLPLENKATCERMVRGEGTTSGSVEGGGVIRELVTPVPAVPPLQPMPPAQPMPPQPAAPPQAVPPLGAPGVR